MATNSVIISPTLQSCDTPLSLLLHHNTFLWAIEYAWLHILQYEVLLHKGDWSSWWSHDMDLTQAASSRSSSSSLRDTQGCWHSTPDRQPPTEKTFNLHHMWDTRKRPEMQKDWPITDMMIHTRGRLKDCSLIAFSLSPDWDTLLLINTLIKVMQFATWPFLVDLLKWFEETDDWSAILTSPVGLPRFRKVKPTE